MCGSKRMSGRTGSLGTVNLRWKSTKKAYSKSKINEEVEPFEYLGADLKYNIQIQTTRF